MSQDWTDLIQSGAILILAIALVTHITLGHGR